jgi:hypothetical protein
MEMIFGLDATVDLHVKFFRSWNLKFGFRRNKRVRKTPVLDLNGLKRLKDDNF